MAMGIATKTVETVERNSMVLPFASRYLVLPLAPYLKLAQSEEAISCGIRASTDAFSTMGKPDIFL